MRTVKSARTVKALKATRAGSLVDTARRKVVTEAARDDYFLARLLTRPSTRSLDGDAFARLGASVAGFRAVLAGLAADAHSATTLAEIEQAARIVRVVRPENYKVAVGQLHDLAALWHAADINVAVLADLETIVCERELAGVEMPAVHADVIWARLLNSEATLAVSAARDAALLLTATSTSAQLRAVTSEVLRISGLLELVDATIMLAELTLAAPLIESTDPARDAVAVPTPVTEPASVV